MVNTLTFSGPGTYPLDTIWPPGHPRHGECSQHMYASGDWTIGGQPTNRDGTVNFNDPNVGVASNMGVNNDPGTGGPVPGSNSWTFSADFAIADWTAGPSNFVFLDAVGAANPPYPAGVTRGLRVGLTRTGAFFVDGQLVDHEESTGLTYLGGPLTVHLEVTPHGLWYAEIHCGGALARVYCGNVWGGGDLVGATFGEMSTAGGAGPTLQLTTNAVSGAEGVRVGPAECPHAPVAAGRAWALWWPH